eukprot:10372164-Heterocapsa_arctica.AAC.1
MLGGEHELLDDLLNQEGRPRLALAHKYLVTSSRPMSGLCFQVAWSCRRPCIMPKNICTSDMAQALPASRSSPTKTLLLSVAARISSSSRLQSSGA